jgi:hypothetical protein
VRCGRTSKISFKGANVARSTPGDKKRFRGLATLPPFDRVIRRSRHPARTTDGDF